MTVADLQVQDDISAAKAKDVDFDELLRQWQSETKGIVPTAGLELSALKATLLTQTLQKEVSALGSLLPVEKPTSLLCLAEVRQKLDEILRAEGCSKVESLQQSLDEWRTSVSQLVAATRKAIQNLQMLWKRRASDAKNDKKRLARQEEHKAKQAEKKRKLVEELGAARAADNKGNVTLCATAVSWLQCLLVPCQLQSL